MKVLSKVEFLESVDMKDMICNSCGGTITESFPKNIDYESGQEIPRFHCKNCQRIYEQTDDYDVE